MDNETILKALGLYLDPLTVETLSILTAISGSITMCCGVADVVKKYNSTPDSEKVVSILLSDLCANHFKQ